MARQKGVVKFEGSIEKLSYYKLNGKDIVRKSSAPTKERINTDPAFINVKANNQEFGTAVKLCQTIKVGLGNALEEFRDSYVHGRLTGTCRKIIQKGKGTIGQREASLKNSPETMIKFQLNTKYKFHNIHKAKKQITTSTLRDQITIIIPQTMPHDLCNKPKNDIHYQLTAVATLVSDHKWDKTEGRYQPTHPYHNKHGAQIQTPWLSCNKTQTNMQLKLQLPVVPPQDITIALWLGIQFSEIIQEQILPFQHPKAMECIAIL